ncbi:MAG: DUF935 family protein [Deltaproteobacteria bacterium]|nr:DUF935 family protein [Deltaproteobacteria bacterium]
MAKPRRPIVEEVAPSAVAGLIALWISELPLDPRYSNVRYAQTYRYEETALHLYRETLRDDRCHSALNQRIDAVVAHPWMVEPGGDRLRDRRAAEDVKRQLASIHFKRICRQLLHYNWYGYAIGEAIWAREAGKVRLHDLRIRAPERFRWGPDGELLLRSRRSAAGEPVPEAKFVTLTRSNDHGDLPHGPGLARWCYWLVWLRRNGFRFWAMALEKFGAPTPKGKYPRAATNEEKDKLLKIIQSLATGAGVIVPEDQDIEFLATMTRMSGDFESFQGYIDRAIAGVLLGQSSTSDQGPWRGTAEVQKDVRDETIAADADVLDEALTRTIAAWLTQWNFPGAATPVIRHDVDPPEDLDSRAEREEKVGRTSGLRPTRNHVEDIYGGEWEPAPNGTPPGSAGVGDDAARFARGDDADAIAAAAEEIAGEWEPIVSPVVDPVLAAARESRDFDDFVARLHSRAPDERALAPASRRLNNTTFSAEVSGQAGLEEDVW